MKKPPWMDEEGEPYRPLEALRHLYHNPSGEQVGAGLRRYALTWLVQMVGMVEADELETLQR